jgi:hypothetical protein
MRKLLRVLALLAVSCGLAASLKAQNGFTTVTGTITGPDGLLWSCGTISAQLITAGGAAPTLNGVGFTTKTSPVGLGCPTTPGSGANGSFAMRLADSGVIVPSNTTWQFTVNMTPGIAPPAGTGPQSFTFTTAINCSTNTPSTCTSNALDISTQLSAAAPKLSNSSGSGGNATGWHRLGTIISSSLAADQNNVPENRTIIDTNCPLLPNLLANETCFRTWATTGWTSGGVALWEAPTADPFAVIRSPTISPASHAHISVTKCGSTYFLTATNALGTSTGIDLYSSATGNQDWALLQANVVVRGGSGFDTTNLGNTHLHCAGDLDATSNVYLYYEGFNGTNWSMGLATCASSCFGGSATWTKSPSNPLISATGTMGGCEFRLLNGVIVARCHGEITATPGQLPSDLWKWTGPSPTGPFTISETVPDFPRATFDEGSISTVGQVNKPTTLDLNGVCYMYYSATSDGSQQAGSFHLKLAVAFTSCAAMALTNGGSIEPDRFTGREWDVINTAYPPPGPGLMIGYGNSTAHAPAPNWFFNNVISSTGTSTGYAAVNCWAVANNAPLQINSGYGCGGLQFNTSTTNTLNGSIWWLMSSAGVEKNVLYSFFDANGNAPITLAAPYWLTATASNTDIDGELSLAAAATVSYTFTGVYTSHPECTLTKQFTTANDMWITYTGTTSFTVNFGAAVTGTVNYHCIGRN